MSYRDGMTQLAQYRAQIADLRRKMREVQATIEPEPVDDYKFGSWQGPVNLSALFGDHDTLIVIHNMGTGCAYCTLWADRFNGALEHLQDRAAFVVASPDAPERQRAFADKRGWRFPMVSYQGNRFGEEMGYFDGKQAMPGVSVFKREGERMMRVSNTSFSPGDDFCVVWHLFDLIPGGAAGWGPKYHYGEEAPAEPIAIAPMSCCA